MSGNEVLTPRSSRWLQFIDELAKAPICFRTTEHARRVLESMPGADVEASLHELNRLGGRCDCEILFDLAGRDEGASDLCAPASGSERSA